MKKIKNDKQLRLQKKLLRKRQQELETLIHADWIELKHTFKPTHLAGELLARTFQSKTSEESSSFADYLSTIAASFTKTAVLKVEERFEDWLKKHA